MGRRVVASGKILGGLAQLEDAHHDTAKVATIPAGRLEKQEEELLVLARSWSARLLFDQVDVLIVDEIGKDISGTGIARS